MKQQQLTDLALRKIYHAEQLGMDAKLVGTMRAAVSELNEGLSHTISYLDQECPMLDAHEIAAVLEPRRNKFIAELAQLEMMASNWTQRRVKSPGGLVSGKD